MLDARSCDPDRIHLLERIISNQMGWHLTGKYDHRDGIHIGGGDSGDGVGDTRPRRDQNHARLAGRSGIAVRRMGRRLFVANEDMPHILLAIKRVVNVKCRASGITENQFNSFVL